jgi:hypothetical protein
VAKKGIAALALVLVFIGVFAFCLVDAIHLLAPHDMPFGVTGSSAVVTAVQQEDPNALDLIQYSSEADLMQAAQRGDIYGGYIPGDSSDTLVTVPAKSFFGEIYVRGGFSDAAKTLKRTITTETVAPLPTEDRTGGVVGLLLLPTLIGGYLIATMLFSFTHRAAVRGRIAIILGFSVAVALITGAVAGLTGAIPVSNLWALLPCFVLVTAAVALAGVAFQHLVKMGTLVVALLFIIIGGAGAGGGGVSLLPSYWQKIGSVLPPQNAVDLYRNVRYFGGHNIVTPIAVLAAYVIFGLVVIILVERRRRTEQPAAAATGAADVSSTQSQPLVPKNLRVPVGLAVLLTTIFAFNYMASGHEPVATELPFGVVGSSSLPQDAQGSLFSLDVIGYPDEAAATQAMDSGEIYGALKSSDSAGSASQLTVVTSISDLSPLDIAGNFEEAAKQSGQTITVKPYAPTPLAKGDPFALVCSLLLVPLLVGGYMSATLLVKALGSASGRWHGLFLLGFAVVTALVIDLVVTFLLDGLPSDSFWIAWAIMALIILSVSLFAAAMRRLIGPLGIFLTIILVIQFGNPSSGGANGVPYLPAFYRELGPFLPPRNAFLLLRNTLYFDGHGIGQPLAVLLAYAVIAAVVLFVFDWVIDKPPAASLEETNNSEAVLAPVGQAP